MQRIALVFPENRAAAVNCARQAADFLLSRGVQVYADREALPMLPGVQLLDEASAADLYIAIGGDGTLLRAAKSAYRQNVPVFGINSGYLGFLTESDATQLDAAMERLLDGDYELDERMLLSASVDGEGRWRAVNDVIITRAGYARLISMRVLVDGELAAEYRADGLIVSTPTGSTGYSLSAGGPVIAPHVDCLIITPVCPHGLQHRPLIVTGGSSIRVELLSDAEMMAMLQADGRNCCGLKANSAVDICRTSRTVKLIRLEKLYFFKRVQQKLLEQG